MSALGGYQQSGVNTEFVGGRGGTPPLGLGNQWQAGGGGGMGGQYQQHGLGQQSFNPAGEGPEAAPYVMLHNTV